MAGQLQSVVLLSLLLLSDLLDGSYSLCFNMHILSQHVGKECVLFPDLDIGRCFWNRFNWYLAFRFLYCSVCLHFYSHKASFSDSFSLLPISPVTYGAVLSSLLWYVGTITYLTLLKVKMWALDNTLPNIQELIPSGKIIVFFIAFSLQIQSDNCAVLLGNLGPFVI